MKDDLKLQTNVIDELDFEPRVNPAHIGVAAAEGVITLSGYTASYAEKLDAVVAARRVKGVRAIADEIEVRYPAERKVADDQIAKRAADILEWDSLLPKNSIQITVRDGTVTLAGNVVWHYQKKAAETDIHKLSGVHGVINNIAIAPHLEPIDVKKKIENALKRHAELEAKAIRVTVKDNNRVVIEGTVDNWDERLAVANAAWSAPGVLSVENKLKIS